MFARRPSLNDCQTHESPFAHYASASGISSISAVNSMFLPDSAFPASVEPLAMFFFRVGAAVATSFVSLASVCAADAPIDFNRDIRPILSNTCFKCHGPDDAERKGGTDGLRLDQRAAALADLGGYAPIIPGNPDESELWKRITSTDPDVQMPPRGSGKKLTPNNIQKFTDWIRQGAPYAKHWSYEPPVRPPVPTVMNTAWPRNDIDRFLLARLENVGWDESASPTNSGANSKVGPADSSHPTRLTPQPEADRYALIRRLSLDLIGLPPKWEEVQRFVQDNSPDAYAQLVDRLLQQPAYGEHWARLWLDLARYADSAGYADDPPRTIWAYRDYVIRAFNQNLPFDQFTIEQIAGDLLPNPTEDQLIATAFHRNTLTNNEGGTNDEEFRNVAVVDRVNTTLNVWMGTTINCAQCHTHKYDPITQEEFFKLFAFFNQSDDADRRDESPLHEIWKAEDLARRNALQTELDGLGPDAEPASAWRAIEVARLRRALNGVKPITTVPVMRDLAADKQRKTQVQRRGNFQDVGAEVTAGVPTVFPALPEGESVNRLALAKWLVDRRNPLTARVVVNRLWEQIFGTGIVATSEEFGSQGDPPVHPELLDWLAVEFMDSGWDLQHMLKLLVTSAAYRQSSHVTEELIELDPDNRLLARGPRFRMSAEMIRDQALAVSGLLSPKMYGPPVKPMQPKLGVNAAFGSGIDWTTSDGEDKYRRALYTTWRRSNPYPSMATFDAPNREVCTLRRARTNTPLQALVTLNDPVYIEAAQALARKIIPVDGSTADKAAAAIEWALSRPATSAERERLASLFDAAKAKLASSPENAKKIATVPLGAAPEGAEIVDLAAWTVVANAVLNLDELFMRR